MPVLGGMEATAQIRAFEAERGLPRVRILFLVASPIESLEWAREKGADGVLQKPIRFPKMEEALREVMMEERARREATMPAVRRLMMVSGHVGRGGNWGA